MANVLKSHPDRSLACHLSEVDNAARLILDRHPPGACSAIDINVPAILHALSGWHDIAKGTIYFQDYIADIEGFQRKLRNGKATLEQKSHTPLGTLLAMRHFAELDVDGLDSQLIALLIALVVRGHHSSMPTLKGLNDTFDNVDLLEDQFGALSRDVLHCHPALAEIGYLLDIGFDNVFDRAGDSLFEIEEILKKSVPLVDRVRFRLTVQFCFSILLEADKALLIHERVEDYIGEPGKVLPATIVEDHPVKPRPGEDPDSEINHKRRVAFEEVVRDAESSDLDDTRPRRLTLPTGLGKTRCAAGWAFHLRRRIEDSTDMRPKIFVVLPFLSVIEQTIDVYQQLLDLEESTVSDRTLQASHSLSVRDHQDIENPDEAEFALDTWRSDIVVTTFDQFLLSLMGDRAKHQQRFHNLCDAIVILDEVQGFPCHLWHPVGTLIMELAAVGRTRFLLMTATQPALLAEQDCVTVIKRPPRYARDRYRMEFDLKQQTLTAWLEDLAKEITDPQHADLGKWLVVLNTRRSAQTAYRYLKERLNCPADQFFLLSSDIVPMDRLERIERIKTCDRCIAVTTQCVEAGVDIDMDRVIRDFAPLDSLIQAAGRCNRNGTKPRATVRIVHLLDEDDDGAPRGSFCNYIYDGALLGQTSSAIKPFLETGLDEEHVTETVETYFREIVEKSVKARGKDITDKWSCFDHGEINVSKLLRGNQDQVSFVVLKRDPTGALRDRIESTWKIEDRWERRRGLRNLAPEIARVTVSAWKSPKWQPHDIADPFPANTDKPSFWFLQDEHYSEKIGLCLPTPLSCQIL